MTLRSPVKYFGGKSYMRKHIIPLIEGYPHRIYCEVFGGGASVLIGKRPSQVEIYNDIDGLLVNLFKHIADPRLFARFYRRVALLPYSRALFYEYRDALREGDTLDQAVKFFYLARCSFRGDQESWSFGVDSSSSGMAATCSSWISIIDQLPLIHARLQRVQIECDDFRSIIATYDTPETLFYLDPPYVAETRKSGEYRHEMDTHDHADLLALLPTLKGAAILSGYDSESYSRIGWEKLTFDQACYSERSKNTNIKSRRQECIWLHPRVSASTTPLFLL